MRLTGPKRKFIKWAKYVLPSHRKNVILEGKHSLKPLLAANRRLNTSYILHESFDQLWKYLSQDWERKFFENWKAQLRWQRLEPYDKFAVILEKHWDGIATYCKPENRVVLGFVEGLNNKIRVIRHRAYGLRDEEYLKLKILTIGLAEFLVLAKICNQNPRKALIVEQSTRRELLYFLDALVENYTSSLKN